MTIQFHTSGSSDACKEQEARYEYTRSAIWKYGNVLVFIRGLIRMGPVLSFLGLVFPLGQFYLGSMSIGSKSLNRFSRAHVKFIDQSL